MSSGGQPGPKAEKIVYILGAGFSRPLGLPLISDFRFMSERLFASDPEKYSHFRPVFRTIERMAVCGYYYDTNIFNIEDILSVLEMRGFLGESLNKRQFTQYIRDVIEAYTPAFMPAAVEKLRSANWLDFILGEPDAAWRPFANFVCSILNQRFVPVVYGPQPTSLDEILCTSDPGALNCYGVITLNYDCILENVCKYINNHISTADGKGLRFADGTWPGPDRRFATPLAKIHGCTTTGVIVPPTWNKGANRTVVDAWKQAYAMLVEATQLRIVGYSLPVADSYIKFLLKAAIFKEQNIKKIEVICWDPKGEVRDRYEDFVKMSRYGYFQFVSARTEDYLSANVPEHDSAQGHARFQGLEKGHSRFMGRMTSP